MKTYAIIGAVIVFATVVYFTGVYTYFIRTEVHEALPASVGGEGGRRVIASGTFGAVDFIHKGLGYAKLLEIDGKRMLRLEDFQVTNGPDLYIYLATGEAPTNDIKSLGDYIDLGPLKATMGEQNYDAPTADAHYKTAVIWCKKFGVLFSYAVMR